MNHLLTDVYKRQGYMVTGWLTLGSDWYYFDNTGKRLTGLQKVGNNLFYFNDSGKMQTDWQKVSNKWYYFDDSGYGQSGWKKLGNTWFYFNSQYQMLTGWQRINGKWYYLSTGVMEIYGKTYYEGYMVTGWLQLENKWYYLKSDGSMVTGYYKEMCIRDSLKEQFNYLKEKYNDVHLIDNPYFDTCNNISSLYVAREHLKNVIILDGDQIINNSQILEKNFDFSGYNCIYKKEINKDVYKRQVQKMD